MIALYRQRDFGDTINATFQYIIQQFRSLGLSLLYIAGPVVLIAGVASGWSESTVRGDVVGLVLRSALISFFSYTLACWLVLLVTYAHLKVYRDTGGGPVLIGSVWREVRRAFGRMVATLIMYSILYLIGSMFLFIPGVYIGVTLSLAFSIVVLEDANPSDAISRCFTLIRDNWWATFGLLLVMGFIYLSLLSLIIVPFIVWNMARIVFHWPVLPPLAIAFFSAFIVLALLLFLVVVILAIGFQYFNLVEQREHVGLIDRIDSIGESVPKPTVANDDLYA